MRLFRPSVLLDADGERYGHAVLSDGDRIDAVGPWRELAAARPDVEVVDLAGCVLMPGTVNAHSHSFQSLLRGLGSDQLFTEWREFLYDRAPQFDAETIHVGALHAFAEMLRNGITTVVDFFYLHHGTNDGSFAVIDAARALGIRLVLARSMMDSSRAPEAFRETSSVATANGRALAARLQGDRLVSVIPAPHSAHGASPEMIRAGADLARDWGVPWHIHVAENAIDVDHTRQRDGLGPLGWLARNGLLDERVQIVHGVHVEDTEIAALGDAGGGLVHCPGSNLFLGDGVCPIDRYRDAGVQMSLGCDSGSANCQLSIFGEMRLAALLQKGTRMRSDALDARAAFCMGTQGGTSATGQPIGALRPGFLADFLTVAVDDLSMLPLHAPLHNIVYSLDPRAIRGVWIGGAEVVRDGRLVRMNEASIATAVNRLAEKRHIRKGVVT